METAVIVGVVANLIGTVYLVLKVGRWSGGIDADIANMKEDIRVLQGLSRMRR